MPLNLVRWISIHLHSLLQLTNYFRAREWLKACLINFVLLICLRRPLQQKFWGKSVRCDSDTGKGPTDSQENFRVITQTSLMLQHQDYSWGEAHQGLIHDKISITPFTGCVTISPFSSTTQISEQAASASWCQCATEGARYACKKTRRAAVTQDLWKDQEPDVLRLIMCVTHI